MFFCVIDPIRNENATVMKKVYRVLFLIAMVGMLGNNSIFAESALDQLNDAARDGDAATSEPTDEGAREGTSYGFDKPSDTPVDLSDDQDVVDPADLKQ
jgi:hypothetical protein